MDPLEAFLQEQRQGRVESQGHFTVALEKARTKLQQYQLADPSFYLLKVFQAAVRAGARRVDARLTTDQVWLWFGCDQPPFAFEELPVGLTNVLSLPDSALRHLAIGMNASLAADPWEVVWACWGPRGGNALAIGPDGLITVQDPPRPRGLPDRPHCYQFRLHKKRTSWIFSETSAEHAALVDRCAYAPVDVYVDNRKLEFRWRSRAQALWMNGLTEPFYLAERLEADPDGRLRMLLPPLRGYKRKGSALIRLGRDQETFFLQSPEPLESRQVTCRAAYAIPVCLDGVSAVTFLRDGVLLESRAVPCGGGMQAILPGDSLQLDLSEFKLVEDDNYKRLVQQARQAWSEMLQAVGEHLSSLQGTITGAERVEQSERSNQSCSWGLMGCIGASVALVGSGLALPDAAVGLVVGLATLGAAIVPWRRKPTDRASLLQQAVRERIRVLLPKVKPGADSRR
ncbi:MAG: hypothetical protein HY319_10615 [Armatimonadetes bacterium]|nr:hypothetical protein [Armatimonadota bacterium]